MKLRAFKSIAHAYANATSQSLKIQILHTIIYLTNREPVCVCATLQNDFLILNFYRNTI